MKIPLTLALCFSATLCGISLPRGSAIAQVTTPNQPDYQKNERSTNGESSLGNFSPLDLIHNANFRRSRDDAEFREDTNTSINQAAEEFKRKQREQLEHSPTPAPPPTGETK